MPYESCGGHRSRFSAKRPAEVLDMRPGHQYHGDITRYSLSMTTFLFNRTIQLTRWQRAALRLAVPFAFAFAIIKLEGWLATIAVARPGILPIAMVSLAAGMLVPAARRWLIVTLCYGIGLLAWRDTFRFVALPAQLDYDIVERIYPLGWLSLSLLAFGAGVVE